MKDGEMDWASVGFGQRQMNSVFYGNLK